ncbi:hypothetical protein RHGRI_013085 [Rhododendron griersonianum]|uniref:Uncharacterized protein n=1 Tax=Rhododendron griersonianum TaxID=479676 RepID=A0AAV6K4M3_9ERIC|nr:hypothetical protein RHGRI_013085 [Rhododendron griersonianum]
MDILSQVNVTDVAHDLPDVNATDVAYDAGMKNLENMQLVLFKDNSKDMAAKRSSRPLEQSCIPQGRGTVSSAVEEAKKPKRKVKSVEEILGIPQARNRKGGKRRKQKCVVFRSALAAAALSVSTEGINNRNRILLNESHAMWTVTNILGMNIGALRNLFCWVWNLRC